MISIFHYKQQGQNLNIKQPLQNYCHEHHQKNSLKSFLEWKYGQTLETLAKCKISGSHGSEYEDESFLGCSAV
jgi:hypothetical protein